MKQLMIALSLCLLAIPPLSARSNYPRQKIIISGSILPTTPKIMSIQDLEKLKQTTSITINDPYDENKKNVFYGFYLTDFIKLYGTSDFKILRVAAIDGYKVDIPKEEIIKEKLFYSYKDNQGYLTVDRMGPGRIIAPIKGIVDKDLLLKIGVYWVWQVKSIEFIK